METQTLIAVFREGMRDQANNGANRAFYTHVCRYISELGFCPPSWPVWLDIRGTAFSNSGNIEAIKFLRKETQRVDRVPVIIPQSVNPEGFTAYVRDTATRVETSRLSLLACKTIIDWLVENESVFDDVGVLAEYWP